MMVKFYVYKVLFVKRFWLGDVKEMFLIYNGNLIVFEIIRIIFLVLDELYYMLFL